MDAALARSEVVQTATAINVIDLSNAFMIASRLTISGQNNAW